MRYPPEHLRGVSLSAKHHIIQHLTEDTAEGPAGDGGLSLQGQLLDQLLAHIDLEGAQPFCTGAWTDSATEI